MGYVVREIEETVIAILLGLMTLITFVNVVLRYGFNTGIIWGLESVTFLFAWLVLFGISYGFKVRAHLGVDALINVASQKTRKSLALITAFVCVLYAFLLLKGSWDYWANFANLPQTTGRWFPTGFQVVAKWPSGGVQVAFKRPSGGSQVCRQLCPQTNVCTHVRM